MKIIIFSWFYFLISLFIAYSESSNEERIKELNKYWTEVSRTVREGDFKGYKATCHKEGVLVSGANNSSYPLSDALARWKKDFDVTKEGRFKADVKFRFSQRINDSTTAHETGIFLYSGNRLNEKPKKDYIHFQALLVKKNDEWKIIMEYQKSKASEAEWNQLKPIS